MHKSAYLVQDLYFVKEIAATKLSELGIATEVFSATSYGELRREAMESEAGIVGIRVDEKSSWVQQQLDDSVPITVAVSDCCSSSRFDSPMGRGLRALCDGFGRSIHVKH